jgi:tRNA threonylcarbamoyladenosine biosynthesis protein TsaB
MKILAFDTATESCSVALTEDSRLLSEITLVNTKTHSRQLTRLIHEVCRLAETDLNEIDGCAVTRGPGSFTGLRIGVSTALGLAQATGRPIVGVSTLQVLAVQAAAPSQMVCPMIDARRGEVYFATYKHTAKHLVAQQSERALNPGDAVDSIGEPCIFVGSGAVLYHDVIRGRLGEAAKFAAEMNHTIRAATVASLAYLRLSAGDADDLMGFVPVYLRPSDAQNKGADLRSVLRPLQASDAK